MISFRDHPHLYEINTWSWLAELSERAGRSIGLADVPDSEWAALEAKGFDFIWLMGIWERSPEARRIAQLNPELQADYARALPNWRPERVVGSPYAIHSYRPDPRLASWDQLDLVRKRLNEREMGLILDFVPNHTALDHAWVTHRPDLYVNVGSKPDGAEAATFFSVQDPPGNRRYIAHGKDPYFPAWSDTAQLNHFNPATRSALLEQLQIVAKHCDGVRCDMAMLVLNEIFEQTWAAFQQHPRPETEFWRDAIDMIPGLVWIAEVYWNRERELQELGFSFTYDKGLYDILREARAQEVVHRLGVDFADQRKRVHFLENHDERRSAAVFGADRFPAVGVLSGTLPGMRFYHRGQLEGKKVRLPIQLCQARPEAPDPYFIEFYEKILGWTNDAVFHQGSWTLLRVCSAGESSHENLVAYQWRSPEQWKLLAVNLSPSTSRGFVCLEDLLHKKTGALWLFDQLTDQTYRWDVAEVVRDGLYIELSSFNAHFFSVRDA